MREKEERKEGRIKEKKEDGESGREEERKNSRDWAGTHNCLKVFLKKRELAMFCGVSDHC